jgi:hypothetical protein
LKDGRNSSNSLQHICHSVGETDESRGLVQCVRRPT